MPSNASVISGIAFERGSAVGFARVRNHQGQYITQATITSITRKVTDITDRNNPGATASSSETVADVVFDTLQTSADDPRYDLDETGFNFRVDIEKTLLANDGTWRVEYEIILADPDANRTWVVFEIEAAKIFDDT